jgi:hypothetical protein
VADRELVRCRYCDRLFFYAPTVKSGGEKLMPIDPPPKAFEPSPGIVPNVILELNGWARVLRRAEMADASLQPRYVPHWASCAYARKVQGYNERRRRRLELEEDQLEELRESH